MTDELNRLEQAFKNDPHAAPRQSARKLALDAAMQAFEEENAPRHQGSGALDRLKNIGNAVFTPFRRRLSMNITSPNLKPLLLGGASLAVLSVAVLNVDHLRQTMPERFGQPAAIETAEQSKRSDDHAAAIAPAAEEKEGRDLAGQIVGGNPEQLGRVAGDGKSVSGKRELRKDADSLEKQFETQAANEPATSKAKIRARRQALTTEGSKFFIDAVSPRKKAGEVQSRIAPAPSDANQAHYYRDQGRDKFDEITPNPVKLTRQEPVSTFSIDVDTASYAFMRASLNNGVLPQRDAVRIEELINYFPYDYAPPEDRSEPFATHVSVMPTPWNTETKLLRIGIKGYELPATQKPRSNLVFLLDVSGSMNAPNKLPLLVNSFKMLLDSLNPDDTVAIVTYAGRAGTVLEPTKVQEKAKILSSLDRLRAGGSTAGAEGIRQAYLLAEQSHNKDGVNRVILATDGDFNVGITNQDELKSFVEHKRQSGISLSVLGFGRGNYNDALMQTLAQNGNGNAAYIDNLSEARKVLVEQASGTLFTIAKDVKIQIEFNPARVAEYRLIGYETRLLQREDFNNDKIDAGEIGAGHTVTALYEMTPVGSQAKLVDSLRYQNSVETDGSGEAGEYAFLKLRYKLPDSDTSTLITTPVTDEQAVDSVAEADSETRFASAVAAYGQILRGGRYTASYSLDDVIALAQGAKGRDEFGYRAEFINLVRLAKSAAAMEPLKQ